LTYQGTDEKDKQKRERMRKKKDVRKKVGPDKSRNEKETERGWQGYFSVTSSNGTSTGTTNYTRGPTQRKG
jgi:hypothetical protein